MNWTAYPLVRLAILFVTGMAMADFFMDFIDVNSVVLIILLCILIVIMAVTFMMRTNRRTVTLFGVSSALFCILFGMVLYVGACNRVKVVLEGDVVAIKGVLDDFPVSHKNTFGLNVKRADERIFHLYVPKKDSVRVGQLHLGDTIIACAVYPRATFAYDNHKDSVDIRNTSFIGYADYLFYNGVSATCYAPSDSYRVIRSLSEPSLIARLRHIGKNAVKLYEGSGLDSENAAIVEAMTIGDKSRIPVSLKNSYSRAGVSHVLALSGFHLTVIYFLLNVLLLGGLTIRKWRWISRIVIFVFIWAFTFMAGMPPSLVRSALMCSLMMLSSVFGLSGMSITSCAFAAVIMLLVNPLLIMNVGFRLSFISVVGICLMGVPLSMLLKTRSFLLNNIWGMMSITLSCTLFTAPLVAYHFGYFSFCSLLSNLFVSLLATGVLAVSALWWMMYPFLGVRSVLAYVLEWISSIMNAIVRWFASFDYAIVEWKPALLEVVLFYVALMFIIRFAYRRKSRQLVWGLSALVGMLAVATIRNLS